MRPSSPGTGAGEVELVCGPPGAGKTSYVLERMAAGNVVVDVDRLFVALTGLDDYDKPEALLPVVLAARDAVVAGECYRRISKDPPPRR